MKNTLILSFFSLLLTGLSGPLLAQIYRCNAAGGGPPEYINNAKDAQLRGCKLLEGGNVTVVQGQPPAPKAPVRVAAASPSGPTTRLDTGPEQKARDGDIRSILESELRKAEARLAEQQKEYNNGEPEKQGIEGRNHQRYLDRVNDLKDGITRNQSDIAGLKREISRLPAVN
ncbi:MAG: hypothetical protein EAZ34_03685 [Polaromonas sp.]|nr:MAG: hypothetical protein EAZ34_03685 [Polaromonas sp.]